MNNTKVSVIVPIYNVERYLKECVDSILAQTLKDIEIILVDDGSPDNCPSIIDDYAAKHSNIKAYHKENGGYGSAMNFGISKATGEYISIVEPDDIIKPTMYEELYAATDCDTTIDVVKSKISSFTKDDISTEREMTWEKLYSIPDKDTIFTILGCPWLLAEHPSTVTCIYRRQFLLDNDIKYIEAKGAGWTDNPFQVQTLCLAKAMKFVNKSFYLWRCSDENSSTSIKNWRIPIERTNEIHEWLAKHNMMRPELLSMLYKREIRYFEMLLTEFIASGAYQQFDSDEQKELFEGIRSLITNMDSTLMLESPHIKNYRKALFIVGKTSLVAAASIIELIEQ